MLTREPCKGCCVLVDCSLPPILNDKDGQHTCPCLICLIKVMCDSECEDYNKYMYRYHAYKMGIHNEINRYEQEK